MQLRETDRINIVPFKYGHLDFMQMRPEETAMLDAAMLQSIAELGQCASVLIDGRIVAIIGYTEMWSGVISVFIIPSIEMKKHIKRMIKYVCRPYIEGLFRDLKIHRMQTTSLADTLHDRFMASLGFSYGGYLPSYGPNREDHNIWHKVT